MMDFFTQISILVTLVTIAVANLYYAKFGLRGRMVLRAVLPLMTFIVTIQALNAYHRPNSAVKGNQTAVVKKSVEATRAIEAAPQAKSPLEAGPASVGSATGGAQDVSSIYRNIGPSVVVVQRYDEKKQRTGIGTGFFVSSGGNVVTNHHVLRGAAFADIRVSSGKVYPVRNVMAEDPENDLIMVSVEIPPYEVQPLTVRASLPAIGERVVVIGSPMGLDQTVSDGIVSAIRDLQGSRKVIQITAPISPGSSGSPVVNMKGDVIAVACALLANGQNLNFGIPSERISSLSPGSGFPLTQISRVGAPFAGNPDEEMRRRVEEARQKAEEDRIRAVEEKRRAREQMINEANDFIKQGAHHMSFSRYLEAFYSYEKALQVCRQLDDVRGMAFCVESMGIAMEKYGRHDIAQDYYRQAASLRSQRIGTASQ
jgi:S1-C subfamily serine protease